MPSLVVLESMRTRPVKALKIPMVIEHNFILADFVNFWYTYFIQLES